MQNNQNSIYIPTMGMDRDSHPIRLKDGSYTFAKNISIEDSSGNGIPIVQNEPSNILCQEIKGGRNVIGFKYEPSLRKTFLFITNTITNVSEVGYISHDNYTYNQEGEIQDCNCEPSIELGTPLEDLIEYTENCEYTMLISDGCTQANKCLNFSINHPVKPNNIVFKNEQCGKRLYWTDGYNPPRYIHLEELEEGFAGDKWKTNRYYHNGALVCKQEIDLVQTCLNCEALKIFPDFSIPCIDIKTVVAGGNLFEGTYEFYIAFCDEEGNEISNYYSHTFPTPIFNFENVVVDSWDMSRQTTYGINIEMSYLDTSFSYYKIVCVFKSAQGQTERYYDLGVFPISQTVVAISTMGNSKDITLSKIITKKQEVAVVDKMSEANGFLFMGGLTAKTPLNLQPIVALMGPFARWNTLIANEKLYKNAAFSQKFRSYMRDESYTFSLTFGYSDGTESSDFILINRGPYTAADYQALGQTMPGDLTVVVNNSGDVPVPIGNDKNVAAMLNSNLACFDTNRIYRWQYYNTALNKGMSLASLVDTDIDLSNTTGLIKRVIHSTCSSVDLNGLNIIPDTNIRIDGDYQFFNGTPAEYLNSHYADFTNPGYPFYSSYLHEFLKLTRYNGLGCFYTLSGTSSNCNNFILESENVNFSQADFVTLTPTMLPFSNYTYMQLDYVETQFTNGNRVVDTTMSTALGLKGYPQIQLRIDTQLGYTCATSIAAYSLNNITPVDTDGFIFKNLGTTIDNYTPDLVFSEYITGSMPDTYEYSLRPLYVSGSGIKMNDAPLGSKFKSSNEVWKFLKVKQQFSTNVAKNAQWFKLNSLDTYPYLQINFKSLSSVPISDSDLNVYYVVTGETDVTMNRLGKVRMSIFDGCATSGNKTAIHSQFFNLTDNPLIDVKTIINNLGLITNKSYIISFDCPIQRVEKQIINFTRRYHSDTPMQENQIPQGAYLHMEKMGMGQNTYYRARNFNQNDQPATTCIDPLIQMNPIAWSSSGNYTELGVCTGPIESLFVPPPAPVADGFIWTTTSLENSFMVTQRGEEVDYYDLTLSNALIAKTQEFQKDCYYKDITGQVCDYENYENGIFAYTESTETYPDNPYLFDASKLPTKITEQLVNSSISETLGSGINDFDIFEGVKFKDLFRLNFGSNSKFVEDAKIDFTCKPIRHFKFPDNTISPFIYTNEVFDFNETFIHPLGVSIDSNVVNVFLNLAVKTGQITQEQRDSIVYFKVNRGTRGINRTVLSKGFLSDMIKYSDTDGPENYYSNFPYNSLNNKELIYANGTSPISHQNGKKGNSRFSFISPEVMSGVSVTPTEFKLDGYVYGGGVRQADEVKEHALMTVLTQNAKDLAIKLGKAEASFELAMNIANGLLNSVEAFDMFYGWTGVGINIGGMINFTLGMGTLIAFESSEFNRKLYSYAYKWMEAFKEAGKGANFAYYLASSGYYNNFSPLDRMSQEQLRSLRISKVLEDGNYQINHDFGTVVDINNIDREKSMYLYMGPNYQTNGFTYPDDYIGKDNSNKEPTEDVIKKNESLNIANLYGGLKIYNPAQYGRIHNITWVPVPGCFYLKNDDINIFFGGDTYISRFSYKKKYNFYLVTELWQKNYTPIKYSRYDNVGKNKYFIDYDSEVTDIGSYGLPFADSAYRLQFKQEHGKYVDGGRFYHYEYGFHDQLVESEINCWTRVALPQAKDNFFPNFPDFMKFTQETYLSIRERESFLYNNVYSNEGVRYVGRFLPDSYEPKFYNCINNSPSGIIRSQVDRSEKRKVDPWLIYKALDFDNFKAAYGKFISLKSIESEQLLALFEHKLVLLNKIDVIRERTTPENVDLGQGIFNTRPIEFHSTDNGYGGSQHSDILSNEFGHFYVDARRGQVFQVDPNGENMTEITTGVRNWFKEHLPFKILRANIDGLTDLDLDNNFKGIGITLGWDSRYKRVFLTKLDYVVKPEYKGKLEYREITDGNSLIVTKVIVDKVTGQEVKFSNRNVFTPAHFTIAYNPLFKTWISYYAFSPNYYISYDNYFRTGLNESNNVVGKSNDGMVKTGIWSHLLTNKSYGVFYGKKHLWGVEIVSKEQFNQKIMSDVNYWLDSLVYHNDYDYAQNTNLGLDSAIIYNNTNNSGKLNLIRRQENNRFQYTKYPIYNTDGSSDILASYDEGSWRFNDFFNRTINENNNVPIWNYDINAIDKVINPRAISFKRTWLDRLRGDYFMVRFEGGSDTRYKQIFKWNYNNEQIVVS
jgi:hypothetical protein